ncbi:true [Symbiodinium sp. KB8]|nr:true [Symbiodinium sp. KB8]
MDAVELYGTPLIDDPDRFDTVTALGLDETLFCREGRFRIQCWSTQIVDVRRGQLLDVVAGRDSSEPCRWLAAQPDEWRARIEWATLDLSASYRAVFDTMLPDAVQVADPFHVVKLANTALDECRRRVQNETLGHRGRKHDPLYRARRRLVMVWFAWNAKEVVRQIYDHTDPELATDWVDEIVRDFADRDMPLEVRRLGRSIARWRDQIIAWHRSHVSNGPTEAVNNLVKRVKRVAFGMRNFAHYRIRSLLYAGKPNWALLDTITPP